MKQLRPEQYAIARDVLAPLQGTHLSVAAVLAGTVRGTIHVDDPGHPRIAYALTPEGHYLFGAADQAASYPALRALIPHHAYLIAEPATWWAILPQIWDNPYAREHRRYAYEVEAETFRDRRDRVPEAMQLVPVDAALLRRTDLRNYAGVAERVVEWGSEEAFYRNAFGCCVIAGATIASRSMLDCALGDRCEIGVGTDIDYRRRGLGAAVVSAMVAEALARGYGRIGWHCLASNRGSIGVAESVGFHRVAEYSAYSSELPAENADDLTPCEFAEWARLYERAVLEHREYLGMAAGARALAGDASLALAHLEALAAVAPPGALDWMRDNWMLHSLHGDPAYEALLGEK